MAVKVDKIKLGEKLDRRVKLLSDDKVEIKRLYSTGNYSLNQLAKIYNVSKKTILLITNDKSKEKNDLRIKNNWGKYQGTKEERNKYTKATREYKRKLLSEGKLNISK